MIIEISKSESVNGKQFNFYIKNKYSVSSIVTDSENVIVTGEFTEDQENEVREYYQELSEGVVVDLEFSEKQTKEQYIKNADAGIDYVFEVSSKLLIMVQTGQVTVVEAEGYGKDCEEVNENLHKGYFHSAYLVHVSITPSSKFTDVHEEIRLFIVNYVNSNYPPVFHIA